MKKLPILAGSQIELDAFLRANPWLDARHVVRVTCARDLEAMQPGLVLGLPGWHVSPSITDPRDALELMASRGMQLVVLDNAAYCLRPKPVDSARDRVEVATITAPPLTMGNQAPPYRNPPPACRDHMAELELAERFNAESG